MIFRAATVQFEFPRPTLIMGIVNVTPDSFSDGGRFFEPGKAIEHGLQLTREGADIIDVGGESTRPGAEMVSEAEELRRVLPVIEGLKERTAVPISIDSQKPAVARAALRAGATIINDIAANRESNEMWQLAAESGSGYVLMHMKGTPQTMHHAPEYENLIDEINQFFEERLHRLKECGVQPEQVLLDPGVGFGKTARHNLELLAGLKRFRLHHRPLLLGVSRKSFIGRVVGGEVHERVAGSIACGLWALLNGVQLIRTHDVAATVQAVRMFEEIQQVNARDAN